MGVIIMEHIGTIIIYIIMVCAVLGAFGAIRNANKGIGKEFMEGIYRSYLCKFSWYYGIHTFYFTIYRKSIWTAI